MLEAATRAVLHLLSTLVRTQNSMTTTAVVVEARGVITPRADLSPEGQHAVLLHLNLRR